MARSRRKDGNKSNVVPLFEEQPPIIDRCEHLLIEIAAYARIVADNFIRGECPELLEQGLNKEAVISIVAADMLSNMRDRMDEQSRKEAGSEEAREQHERAVNELLWDFEYPKGDR